MKRQKWIGTGVDGDRLGIDDDDLDLDDDDDDEGDELDIVDSNIELLAAWGVHLAADTTEANFMERLNAALVALVGAGKGPDDEDEDETREDGLLPVGGGDDAEAQRETLTAMMMSRGRRRASIGRQVGPPGFTKLRTQQVAREQLINAGVSRLRRPT